MAGGIFQSPPGDPLPSIEGRREGQGRNPPFVHRAWTKGHKPRVAENFLNEGSKPGRMKDCRGVEFNGDHILWCRVRRNLRDLKGGAVGREASGLAA